MNAVNYFGKNKMAQNWLHPAWMCWNKFHCNLFGYLQLCTHMTHTLKFFWTLVIYFRNIPTFKISRSSMICLGRVKLWNLSLNPPPSSNFWKLFLKQDSEKLKSKLSSMKKFYLAEISNSARCTDPLCKSRY